MVVEMKECGDDRGNWDMTPNERYRMGKENKVGSDVGQQRGLQLGGVGMECGHRGQDSQGIAILLICFPRWSLLMAPSSWQLNSTTNCT